MKKVGYFFYIFLPVITALAIMFLISFFAVGLLMLFALSPESTGNFDLSDVNDVTRLIYNNAFSGSVSCAFSIVCITVFGLWYYGYFEWELKPGFKKYFRCEIVLALILLVPVLQFLSSLIVEGIAFLFPPAMDTYNELIDNSGLASETSFFMFLYSVLLAPLGEELIFRGVTLRAARRTMPFWLANLMQALLFGIFHMNLIQGCYAFFAGLILGYVCEKTGTIYYSMCLHLLFNLWGSVIRDDIHEKLFSLLPDSGAVINVILVFVVYAALAALSTFLLSRGIQKINRRTAIPETLQSQESSLSS